MLGNDECEAYIDKLAFISTNYSPGRLIISANAGGYGDTNYYFDGIGGYPSYPFALEAFQGVISNGVSSSSVDYVPYGSSVHITQATNVAGYLSWGENGGLGSTYPIDRSIAFTGSSGWYVIETIESFNGQIPIQQYPQGNFTQWFADDAFCGTEYSNTPVGGISNVEEPYAPGNNNSSLYFGYWASGRVFAYCAWNSFTLDNQQYSKYLQVLGDPFTKQ
jgi:hypothetical protein